MTTTITEIADERRLYETIEKRHREALRREQIRVARVGQPSRASAVLMWARKALGGRMAHGVPEPQPTSAPVDAVAEAGYVEQPAGSIAGH